MGLFDPSPEKSIIQAQQKAQLAAEKREKEFIKERDLLNSTTGDDATYIHQQDSKSDLIRWQQELDDENVKLIYFLKGYSFDGKSWVKITKDLAKDTFISYVLSQIQPFLSRNMINSNFDEARILSMLKYTCNDLADAMSDNYESFGIGLDISRWDLILREIKNTIQPSAFRAKGGWTKKVDSTMNKRVETYQEQQQDNKQHGLMGLFKKNY